MPQKITTRNYKTEIIRLEKQISEIKQRNRKVELDKAWETSAIRRLLLALFTYLAIGAYFQAVGVKQPWLNAIAPAAAFMLSTLTLPFFKRIWERYLFVK